MGYVELVMRDEGHFKRLYARKRLHLQYRSDPSFRSMFVDEARLAGLIRHPNVVSVIDIGEDDEGPFLIMDYVEGSKAAQHQPSESHPPIGELIAFEGKSPAVIEAVLEAAAAALTESLGVPGNVFLTYREARAGQTIAGDAVIRR